MNLKIIEKDKFIKGVYLLQNEVYSDERGSNYEIFDVKRFNELTGEDFSVNTLSFSESRTYTLRGYHSDDFNSKAIFLLKGEIFLSIIDLRPDSETHGAWQNFYLNEKDKKVVVIKPGIANLHIVLSKENSVFGYCWSKGYTPHSQQKKVLKWYDAKDKFKIKEFPVLEKIITSERDR